MKIINCTTANAKKNTNGEQKILHIGRVSKITLGRGSGDYVEYPVRVKYVRV